MNRRKTAHPALGLLEFSSIALGTRASDALLKKAPVTLLRAGTLQPGKYAIVFAGDTASVDESFVEGRRIGEAALLDAVLLPDIHPKVLDAANGMKGDWGDETVGIIETPTLAAVVRAADAAIKGAEVEMVSIRLGDGLGGKGLAHFSGLLADVEAAIEIGTAAIADRPQSPCTSIIPRFDDVLRANLDKTTRFWEAG